MKYMTEYINIYEIIYYISKFHRSRRPEIHDFEQQITLVRIFDPKIIKIAK